MSLEALRKTWPEWQIEEKPIGKDVLGVTYKAYRTVQNKKVFVAIKELSIPADPADCDSMRSDGLTTNAIKTHFKKIVDDCVYEIERIQSLNNFRNIVKIEDYTVIEKNEDIGWNIYIRTELLSPLNTYMLNQKLNEDEIIKLGIDLCSALEICEKKGIIHHDIRPENIFVNESGDFKLGNLGFSRRMADLSNVYYQRNQFSYTAPEVAENRQYNATADIYSLGLVLYQLFNSNRLPFLDREKKWISPAEKRKAADRRLQGEDLPAPCNASLVVTEIILCACSYDWNQRFPSATDMKQALIHDLHPLQQSVSEQGVPEPTQKKTKKWFAIPVITVALAAIVLFVVIGLKGKEKAVEDIEQIISYVSKLSDEGQFDKALAILDEGLSKYPKNASLASMRESVEDDCKIIELINEADKTLAEGNYQKAVSLISKAKDDFPDNEQLIAEEAKITSVKPVYLLDDVRPYKCDNLYDLDTLFSMGDSTYTHGFTVRGVDSSYNNEDGKYYFFLDAKYSVLSFTAGITERNYNNRADIQFFADGAEIYNFSISPDDSPSEHHFNVEGCHQLILRITEEPIDYSAHSYGNIYGFANILAQKSVTASDQSSHKELGDDDAYLLKTTEPYEKGYGYYAPETIKICNQDYSHGFTCEDFENSEQYNTTYFKLDDDYRVMSFVTGITESKNDSTVTFTVYGDGNPIYSYSMENDDVPAQHTIDISGCSQLAFNVTDNSNSSEYYNRSTYAVADIIISKNN